jgi:hypothetical protein
VSHEHTKDQPFFAYLDTVGDGSGTKNAIGNYLSTAEEFLYTAYGQGVAVNRLIIMIEDGTGIRAERYASLAQALTNGVTIYTKDADGNTMEDLTAGIPIKQNAQWGALCYDVELREWGAGNEFILVRWTFGHAGNPLHLDAYESIVVGLNDDFTEVVTHTFMIQGTHS